MLEDDASLVKKFLCPRTINPEDDIREGGISHATVRDEKLSYYCLRLNYSTTTKRDQPDTFLCDISEGICALEDRTAHRSE